MLPSGNYISDIHIHISPSFFVLWFLNVKHDKTSRLIYCVYLGTLTFFCYLCLFIRMFWQWTASMIKQSTTLGQKWHKRIFHTQILPNTGCKCVLKMINILQQLLVVCSLEEAGRYLETYKSYESKPPDLIMEKSEGTYMSRVNIGTVPVLLSIICVLTVK